MRVPFGGPWITELEKQYVLDALEHSAGDRHHEYIDRFEAKMCEICDVPHVIATSSCTGALHLALAALKELRGWSGYGEIVVPGNTWTATAAVVRYVGLTPVFADVESYTGCITPETIEDVITPNTVAVLPVHMYGHPADMETIGNAFPSNIAILADAAPALGSRHYGHPIGQFGIASCFSFQGAKVMVSGEGGAFVTSDSGLAHCAKWLSNQCRNDEFRNPFMTEGIGLKYKMNNITAALALAQIERMDEIVARRRQIAAWYKENLEGCVGIQTICPQYGHSETNYYLSTLTTWRRHEEKQTELQDRLFAVLTENEIEVRPFFPTLNHTPAYSKFWRRDLPIANDLEDRGICLPSATLLTRDQVEFTCDIVRAVLKEVFG